MNEQDGNKSANTANWIFGVITLLIGFTRLPSSPLSALCYIAISFLLLPPLRKLVHQKTNIKIPTWGKGVAIVSLIIISGTALQSSQEPQQENITTNHKVSVQLPSYSLLEDKSYEKVGKAQVEHHIVVGKNHLTKKTLTLLLKQLYEKAAQITDWKYHDTPTVVLIQAYTSKQHYESGNMIGEVYKMPATGPQPHFKFNDGEFQNLNKLPETKWGMTEEKRQHIYAMLGQTHIRAIQEADNKFPNFGIEHSEYVELLTKKYTDEILLKFELTEEQYSELCIEGMQKNWPDYQSAR